MSAGASHVLFLEQWTAQVHAAQQLLEEQPNPSVAALQELVTAAQTLQDELTARAGDLPPYELRRSEQAIKSLLERLSVAKAGSSSKPKFSFTRQVKPASSTPKPSNPSLISTATSLVTPADASAPRDPPAVPPTALRLAALPAGYVTYTDLDRSDVPSTASQSLLVSSLSKSLVDLLPRDAPSGNSLPTFSALYLYDLTECVVLLPPISGSVMLHNCRRCKITLGVHQFRMHDSNECILFVHSASQPIIERCSGLTFGPYPASFVTNDLGPSSHAQVQDFDHPFASADAPSPSWRLASESLDHESSMLDPRWQTPETRKEHWQDLLRASVQ